MNSAVVIVVKKMRLAAVATGLTNVTGKVRTVTLIGKTGNRICNILCYKGAHFLPQLTFVAWILFDLFHFYLNLYFENFSTSVFIFSRERILTRLVTTKVARALT